MDVPVQPQQQVAQQPPQIEFALTPGQLRTDAIIDYSTVEGRKLYKSATEPLQSLHDLSADNLRDFLKLLQHRVNVYDWNTILDVPIDDGHTFVHLIRQYGGLTLEQVRTNSQAYIGNESRAAQESQLLADCIFHSLTVEARNTVTLYEDDYTINSRVDGPCLLKVVIRESHIDTNATTRILREELARLDSYMVSIDSDILKFNRHVKSLLERLHARNGTTQDLLVNLFRAYAVVSDKDFVSYIRKKEDEYDEGQDIDPNTLMLLAANKYKTKKGEDKWNAPSKEEEELIALRAQVEKLRISKANKVDLAKGRTKENSPTRPETPRRTRRRPKWMYMTPKEGEAHKKTVNNKVYHWCPKHEMWVRHTPQQCEGKGRYLGKRRNRPNDTNKKDTETESQDSQQPSKKLKVAEALLGVIQENDE